MSQKRIDSLIAKKAQIDAQLRAARARERKKQRNDDTRRKIITGALALNHAEKNPNSEFAQIMLRLIREYVVTDTERALFDLDPLPEDDTRKKPTAPAKLHWRRVFSLK